MEDDAHTEYIHIAAVDLLLLVVVDDLRGDEARRAALGEDDALLVLVCGQAVVDDLKPLVAVALVQGGLALEQDVFGLDVAMHDVLALHVLDALQDLLYNAPDLL